MSDTTASATLATASGDSATSTSTTDQPFAFTADDLFSGDDAPVQQADYHLLREPATDAEEPEATTAERDAQGRFTKKDAAEPEPAADAQPETPTVEPKPLQYRANGETRTAEGYVEQADGSIVVSKEKVGELRDALNARVVVESHFRPQIQQRDETIATLKQQLTQRSEADVRSTALVTELERALRNPDEVAAIEAFYNLRTHWDTLILKAENEYLKTTKGQLPEAQPATARTQDAPSPNTALPEPEQIVTATKEVFETLRVEVTADSPIRDLTDPDWQQLVERVERTPFAYLRRATAEDAAQYGVTQGEIVLDTDAIHADAERLAVQKRQAKEQDAAAKRKAELAAENARRTTPSISAPPTAGSGRAPSGNSRRSFQNESDLNAWLDSDEL